MAQPTRPEESADEQLVTGSSLIKRLRKLVTQRKARSRERAFVVDGPTLVAEALDPAGATVVQAVVVGADALDDLGVIRSLAAERGVAVHVAVEGLLDSILDPVTPRPVAAIVARRSDALTDVGAGLGPVLCLVEARDPGNVGTLIRSVEASGAAGIVLAGRCVDPTNPKTVRASAGSVLRTPVVEVTDVSEAVAQLRATGRRVVATLAGGEAIPYDEVRLADAAILLGNEAHGLPDSVIAEADVAARIPLAGRTESLNLAVAGSLFCFEARRQARRGSARSPGSASNSLDT